MSAVDYKDLASHYGHKLEVAKYGDGENATIECMYCSVVLLSFDNETDEDVEPDEMCRACGMAELVGYCDGTSCNLELCGDCGVNRDGNAYFFCRTCADNYDEANAG